MPAPTDRDILTAILNAVIAIGERLTGEKMVVRMWCEADGSFGDVGSGGAVRWISGRADTPPAAASRSADQS